MLHVTSTTPAIKSFLSATIQNRVPFSRQKKRVTITNQRPVQIQFQQKKKKKRERKGYLFIRKQIYWLQISAFNLILYQSQAAVGNPCRCASFNLLLNPNLVICWRIYDNPTQPMDEDERYNQIKEILTSLWQKKKKKSEIKYENARLPEPLLRLNIIERIIFSLFSLTSTMSSALTL